jgi:RNA polymerase sigma-70 factor (ECF subfamily)
MSSTSVSLLERARRGDDEHSWRQFAEIYTPLLRSWLGRHGMQTVDVDDVVQETLLAVSRELPSFDHSGRRGAFRSWLRNILVFRLQNFWRDRKRRLTGQGQNDFLKKLSQLEDPHSELSQLWDREHDRHLVQRLLAMIEPRFQPSTCEAFRRVVLEGRDAAQVGLDLEMTLNAVIIAKSRVLKELRNEAGGLLDR